MFDAREKGVRQRLLPSHALRRAKEVFKWLLSGAKAAQAPLQN